MTINRGLMITERFPPDIGGVAKSSYRTVAQFHEIGVTCDVLSWTKALPPGQLDCQPIFPSGPLSPEKVESPIHYRFGMFGNFDLTLQHSMNVLDWLQEENRYQFLWGHYLFPAGFLTVMKARLLGIPSIVSARGNDIDRLMFPPGDFARLLWTLQNCDRITSVSAELSAKIQAIDSGLSPVVIRNSVQTDLFCPAAADPDLRKQLGIYPQEVVLGFCGELRHKKGLPFLIQALRHVRTDRPACLLVIGSVRPGDRSTIEEHFQGDQGSKKRLIVTGDLPSPQSIAKHFGLCDLVLSPSVWDGLPNAVLEAMSCGKMVLASDAGGHPEIIDHGKDGFLLSKSKLNHLGQAILECLDLSAEAKSTLQENARSKIQSQFNPQAEQTALRELIEGLSINRRE